MAEAGRRTSRTSCTSCALAFLLLLAPAAQAKPHIVHILADDFGWADVGWHRSNSSGANGSDVETPQLDALVKEGVELDRFYAHKICSPSRCALQSGRHAVHVNVQNVVPEVRNSKDPIGGYQGIPVNMTGVAAQLRRAGYRTHLVGKWDAGMATELHHPRARGYETWLGYWHHSNDYWAQTEEKCSGTAVRDLWAFNATYDGPATHLANGPHCSQKSQAPAGERCVFEELLLRDEVVRLIEAHDAASPLFLLYSMHLVHMPLQAPQRYVDHFGLIDDEHRRLNHAMGRAPRVRLKLWPRPPMPSHRTFVPPTATAPSTSSCSRSAA